MFGRNRRLATEHTINAVRPIIGIVQNFQGLPSGFWRDEFVLGFVGFMVGFHANYTSGRNLSSEDKGQLLIDVFTALSNLNGAEIARESTRLALQSPKSPDFERGADNAAICAFASIGKVSEQGRPHYEQAKEIALSQGQRLDHSAVAAVLMKRLFFDPLREKFQGE